MVLINVFRKENLSIPLLLAFLFFVVVAIVSLHIPFFWDEVYYVSTAHNIYDSNFNSIVPPLLSDRGNFPLYGFYMAVWWKIFGKCLAISHIAILPILFGIIWEYYLLAKKIIPKNWIPLGLLLLILEPTFLTQSILMGHDLFLLYFFLLSVRALLYDEKKLYVFAFCLLAVHNIKGIPVAFSVFLFYFFHLKFILNKKLTIQDWLMHILPAIIWILWMSYHKMITGWYVLTPINDFGNGLHLDSSLLKRIILGIWQITDFGRIFLWMFIIGGLFFIRKREISFQLKTLFLLLLIPTIVLLIFFALVDIDLCHRYFMVIFLIVNLSVCYMIAQFISKKMLQYLITTLLCIGLITGNFWLYGRGFSNGWDSSLKVLPYFGLRDKMIQYVKDQKINLLEVGTKFPLHQDLKYSDLALESFHFIEIENVSLQKFKYILLSNVNNQFAVKEKEKLKTQWILLKEFDSGQVYLQLFKNPEATDN